MNKNILLGLSRVASGKKKKHVDGVPAVHDKLGKCLIVPDTDLTKDLSKSGIKYIRIFVVSSEKFMNCPKFYVRKKGEPTIGEEISKNAIKKVETGKEGFFW